MNKEGYFYLFATMVSQQTFRFYFRTFFYSNKYSRTCNLPCFQDFSKLNFKHFLHGGVNVTGFDLVNTDDPKVKSFLRRWRTANQVIYPAAGQPLMVISQHIFLTVFRNSLWFQKQQINHSIPFAIFTIRCRTIKKKKSLV